MQPTLGAVLIKGYLWLYSLGKGGNHLKKKMTPVQKSEAKWGLAFVAPTMIGLIILNFYPIFNTIYQSFCKTGDFGRGNTFVGLANYQTVLKATETWQSLWNTIKYALIEVPLRYFSQFFLIRRLQDAPFTVRSSSFRWSVLPQPWLWFGSGCTTLSSVF